MTNEETRTFTLREGTRRSIVRVVTIITGTSKAKRHVEVSIYTADDDFPEDVHEWSGHDAPMRASIHVGGIATMLSVEGYEEAP